MSQGKQKPRPAGMLPQQNVDSPLKRLATMKQREIEALKSKHFDAITAMRKELNEAYAKIRTLTWQLANAGIVAAKSLPDEAEHRTDVDNAATGLKSGKDLNMDEVVNAAKHDAANLLGEIIDENGRKVVLVKSRSYPRFLRQNAPESGSPAAADGCTEYRVPTEGGFGYAV